MNSFIERFYRPLLIGLIATLVVLSFLIGKEEGRGDRTENGVIVRCDPAILSALTIEPAKELSQSIPETPTVLSESNSSEGKEIQQKGVLVGSKNGTKYYTPGCPGALRIKPENYRWFSSQEDATMQGYSKGSC